MLTWNSICDACNGAFPYIGPPSPAPVGQATPPVPMTSKRSNATSTWAMLLNDEVLGLARTAQCFQAIDSDPFLNYKLPEKGAVAGQILKHVYTTLENHLDRHKPSIYKIGYTHNPAWRFHNSQYGYCKNVEGWEGMTTVFAADNTIAPAFVEAATIQRHLGLLSMRWFFETFWNVGVWTKTYTQKSCSFSYILKNAHNSPVPRTTRLQEHPGWRWNRQNWWWWALYGLLCVQIIPKG